MQVLSRATFFSHENDNSCHIKFPTVLMDCNVYAPRTYFFFDVESRATAHGGYRWLSSAAQPLLHII